jgi:tRNA (guanine10-N2)-dimethyltransferase
VHENKLIERGYEAVLVEEKGKFIIGRTIEVQDYKTYSKFDYGRPARDDKAGMIPPKLAQMMINLSKAKPSQVIYDPFCGSGTFLTEAAVLGFEQIIGSDISEKAIADSKANLAWVEQKFDTKNVPDENVFLSDVLNPTKNVEASTIVGEGYLGEPVRRDKEQAIRDAKALAAFYEEAITNLTKMLTPNSRLVLAIPFFIVRN